MLMLFVAGYGVGVPLSVANGNFEQDSSLLLAFAAFMVVGAIIVAHRPGNAVGWVFSAIGLLTATGVLATEYAAYASRTRSGSLPGVVLAAWYSSWWWYPTLVGVLVVTPLVFPTGRLLSTRWRPVAMVTAVGTVAIITLSALQPTLQNEDHPVRNPIGLAGVPDPEEGALGVILFGLLLLCSAAAVTSVVLRFRGSQGVERQQLKWFTYAATLLILFLLLSDYLLPQSGVVELLYGLAVALVPIAAGVAILRHRLYDIDRLINRTLVYGLLTALLGAVYAAAVLVLGQVFGGMGGDPPSWAVAGATLAVAALFQPARSRTQTVVDRRFNRRKDDAAKTIQAFSTRLRDQIDLDTLSAELLAVVDQSMEPTRVSLWLRPRSIPGICRVEGGGERRSSVRPHEPELVHRRKIHG
jgi:MFS family permease